MRPILALLLLCSTAIYAQPQEEYFTVGDSRVATDRHMLCGAGWKIYEMDEGTSVSFEKMGSKMSLIKYKGVYFISSGCGYDVTTGNVDSRTMSMLIVQPPIVLMKEELIHVECEAGTFIRLGRMVNP